MVYIYPLILLLEVLVIKKAHLKHPLNLKQVEDVNLFVLGLKGGQENVAKQPEEDGDVKCPEVCILIFMLNAKELKRVQGKP
jgi:hypothetical protein